MATSEINKVMNDSTSNYCKMPDGTLIHWGSGTADSAGSLALTFSPAFNAIPSITASNDGWNPVACGFAGLGNSYGTLRTSANTKVYWQAIGRWK